MFKGYSFPSSIILYAVYLKLRFSLSYRDIEHAFGKPMAVKENCFKFEEWRWTMQVFKDGWLNLLQCWKKNSESAKGQWAKDGGWMKPISK